MKLHLEPGAFEAVEQEAGDTKTPSGKGKAGHLTFSHVLSGPIQLVEFMHFFLLDFTYV